MESPRTAFLGTPAFAIPILHAIEELGWPVVGVYTGPDRPAGRGRTLSTSPVKRYAQSRGMKVLSPGTVRGNDHLETLRALSPDLLVLAAYGRLLPGEFLKVAGCGALNVHPSLLPLYRGAIPVQAAIRAGDMETGTTLMVMDEGLDTGPIVAQEAFALDGRERTPELTDRLFMLGARLLRAHAPAYLRGDLKPVAQPEGSAPLPRLAKTDGELDWEKAANTLERQVRAYKPWPGAYTTWRGVRLEVVEAEVLAEAIEPLGTVVAQGGGIGIVTRKGVLGLRRIRLAGRTEVPGKDFVRGHPDFLGTRLPS